MKNKLYACLVTIAFTLGFLSLPSMSSAATINEGPLAGKQLALYCAHGKCYKRVHWYRHGYHRCFWVPGHKWRGYWIPGHRVCRY